MYEVFCLITLMFFFFGLYGWEPGLFNDYYSTSRTGPEPWYHDIDVEVEDDELS